MTATPIAIVGRACILPGARTPEELFAIARDGKDALTSVSPGRWGIDRARVMGQPGDKSGDRAWTDRGGYVHDFERYFDASGFGSLSRTEVLGLDPLFQWTLHVAREALRDANLSVERTRVGAILGNLSFPTDLMGRYAAGVWLEGSAHAPPGGLPDARNRFMSGLPAHLLGDALGLRGPRHCLDAACASSLYAIALACDALRRGEADAMLAGAVNRADDLFIHVGFCALSAMSKSGQSRPFHPDADGLVPAEGCAMVVLRRLDDAVAAGERILGVIRAVGLSNDGRARGLLAPSEEGQVRAMRAAWSSAGLLPSTASYLECHATGTPVGDATEIRSASEVFRDARDLAAGSLKANLGHLVTVAGAAGLIKVLSALEHDVRPPTPHLDRKSEALRGAPMRVLDRQEAWPRGSEPRRAAVSAFGFGGNNAHLVLEEWRGQRIQSAARAPAKPSVAIVAMGARVGTGRGLGDFTRTVLGGASEVRPREGDGVRSAHADEVALELEGLRFPPVDLARSIAQQTAPLAAAREAGDSLPARPADRVSALVGMGTDPEVARWGARWRIAQSAAERGASQNEIDALKAAMAPALDAPTVLGTMPNIPANRLNTQLDAAGPSFTVSSEEQSGLVALQIARRALEQGDVDRVYVGAADFSAERVHERALAQLLGPERAGAAGDAAIVLVLEREADARAAGLPILALLGDETSEPCALTLGDQGASLTPLLGRSHAAHGLLHTAAATVSLLHGKAPISGASHEERRALVHIEALSTAPARVSLRCAADHMPRPLPSPSPAPSARALRMPAHGVPRLPSATSSAKTSLGVDGPRAPTTSPTTREELPMQRMDPAPMLPPVLDLNGATKKLPSTSPTPIALTPAAPARPAPSPAAALAPVAPSASPITAETHAHATEVDAMSSVLAQVAAHQAQLGAMHRGFLDQQAALHRSFLESRQRTSSFLIGGASQLATLAPQASSIATAPLAAPAMLAAPTAATSQPSHTTPTAPMPAAARPAPVRPAAPPSPAKPAPTPASSTQSAAPKARGLGLAPAPNKPRPVGPTFDREALKIHAGHEISKIFGPLFEQQDQFKVQVRMPMEPMLLADRVTGIDATPGVHGRGTVWTETDVRHDSWWLGHDGRMPAGIMIESGQADLFLISYMGADFLNRGERAYRLLGCDLTYHGALPKPGETLAYDIHIDGHAAQGDVRLFFFHYDCHVDGRPALTVRNGQAGFFTREELDDSAGILWRPETQEIEANARVDAPALSTHRSFDRAALEAFTRGEAAACFGEAWRATRAHVRTPRIEGGRMLFLDRVDVFDPKGGPWKRGYLKATTAVTPDDWFFPGHFHEDPCMPGTLMFEACLQTMAFYLSALGYTVDKDGWRFEPVPEEKYAMRCRGQVTPTSRELVYEVFVEEVHDGPYPTLFADLICSVDGLGAFHARRMGMRLVPDWPLASRERLFPADALAPAKGQEPHQITQTDPSKPVAVAPNGPSAGFRFDYQSLLACAWGQPSSAFGPIYSPFDDTRRVARLPGPPYHFMSRIAEVEGPMGEPKAGARVVVEYDVPRDAWYFADNGARSMPMCVLMEAALQPCGWLASYVGCALASDIDVLFRNLDGKGVLHAEVLPSAGTLRTEAKLKSVSRAGTMIIVGFDVRCTLPSEGDRLAYTLDTVFGFFPTEAFIDQAGLPVSAEQRALFETRGGKRIDLSTRPPALCEGSARLATPFLLMLDRVVHLDPQGGAKGLGAAVAQKDVDPDEWFFKAHFFQDPVQPGSLGIEAMVQLLQLVMLDKGMAAGMTRPRFESIAVGRELVWKYRGQVVPDNAVIGCSLEITEEGRDERGPYAVAAASLWVDGKRIYDARELGMRIIEAGDDEPELDPGPGSERGAAASGGLEEKVLDASRDTWLADHMPTWVIPALPAMCMLDELSAAASKASGGAHVIGVEELQIQRWITFPEGPVRIRARADGTERADVFACTLEVFREARDPRLSRFEPAASARIMVGDYPAAPAAMAPLGAAVREPDPYEAARLFHGPAFQLLRSLRSGRSGSSALLDASAAGAVPGTLRPALLDAATHGIPHDAMETWSDEVPTERAAYPFRVERASFFGPAPSAGEVRVEARFKGWDGVLARVHLELVHEGRTWCTLDLAEILLPKGPIGVAPPHARAAFLRDRSFQPGVALSGPTDSGGTRVELANIVASNWLPGTIERVYGTPSGADLGLEVAARDHVAAEAQTHPSLVLVAPQGDSRCSAADAREPLHRWHFDVTRDAKSVTVSERAAPAMDLTPVREAWRTILGANGAWPGEDLYVALISRFVRSLRVEDPAALARVRGRGLLFLANHQVGIESLLFGIAQAVVTGAPTLTLAKEEHRHTWLGRLIEHGFSYPGIRDPKVIAFFDRQDPAGLPKILGELGEMLRGGHKNVMIHVEGTRSTSCARPAVTKMSGVFVDMAIALGAPIVPLRFVGGLPQQDVDARLEFPYRGGRQDYVIGAPIEPAELAELPYKERNEIIASAINGLGPAEGEETPIEGDVTLDARAAAWAEKNGIDQAHATILAALEEARDLGPELSAVVRAARGEPLQVPAGPAGAWLRELASRLGC